MRPFWLAWAVVFALGSAADTIVLKNGRRVVAESVTEEGSRVIYQTQQGAFTLPKSLVDRVERDSSPTPAASDGGTGLRKSAAVPKLPVRSATPERLFVDGQVDRRYLEDLARQPALSPMRKEMMVDSFLAAVEFEIEHGRMDSALELAKMGAEAAPTDPRMLMGEAVVLIQRQEYRQAREILMRACTQAPTSADAWKFLGFAEYNLDRVEEAIRNWKKSLSLSPDPEVEKLLERAQRETAAEERFLEASSGHFTLRFEGRQISPEFGREILAAMELLFRDLERDLEDSPRDTIMVILYTGQAFYDVTQAPSWTGALFDGKIRVPLEGLTSVTPELRSVLRHEMTHSFVRARAKGRCPAWLNEGLAQVEEGKTSARYAARLQNGRLPLTALTEPFAGLDASVVPAAYAVSLAAVEMLKQSQGLGDLGRVLDRLATGTAVDAAFRSVYRMSLADVETDLTRYLQKQAR